MGKLVLTCKELLAQLSEFLDDELDATACAEIQKHLTACPNCRVGVNTLHKTITLYRNAPNAVVPPDVHGRLIQILDLQNMEK